MTSRSLAQQGTGFPKEDGPSPGICCQVGAIAPKESKHCRISAMVRKK